MRYSVFKMATLDEHLIQDIDKLCNSIKRKYKSIVHNISEEESFVEKRLKPITEPLKQLVEGVRINKGEDIPEQVEKEEEEPVKKQDVISPRRMKLADEYTNSALYNTKRNVFDHIYGVHYSAETDEWMLGSKAITLQGNCVFANERKFCAGRGLYELLFKTRPQNYTEKDLKVYKLLLKWSGAHLNSRGHVKTGTNFKYQTIIRELFPPTLKGKQYSRKGLNEASGSGLSVQDVHSPIKYVYWNNANEIVDRLRILIASKEAGHTAHDLEIASIIEELTECGVIVGGALKTF